VLPERKKKVTIQDVARYANVSAGTIDRVLHNRGKVSEENRQKIEKAIKKLNFNPNLLARTLALGEKFHIHILLPAAPSLGHYWSMPLKGIELAASQYYDYGVTTEYYYYDLFDEISFVKQTSEIMVAAPDAVILAPLFLNESRMFVHKLQKEGIPCVLIDTDLPGEQGLSYIGPDLKSSAFIAGRLLDSVLPDACEVLIVNMVKGFENASALKRIESGFRSYFSQSIASEKKSIKTLTINPANKAELFYELEKFYTDNPDVKGTFVTNSKAYLVSEFHKSFKPGIRLVGYDLVEENIAHLKDGGIDFIISQSPVQQGERAMQTLFDFFVFKKEPDRIQHVPLDIIIRENVDFYTAFNKRLPNGMKQ
jgi:LacI family transcriptional regulator